MYKLKNLLVLLITAFAFSVGVSYASPPITKQKVEVVFVIEKLTDVNCFDYVVAPKEVQVSNVDKVITYKNYKQILEKGKGYLINYYLNNQLLIPQWHCLSSNKNIHTTIKAKQNIKFIDRHRRMRL